LHILKGEKLSISPHFAQIRITKTQEKGSGVQSIKEALLRKREAVEDHNKNPLKYSPTRPNSQ